MLPLEKIASQFEILVLWSCLREDAEERFKVVVWKCPRLLASISAYYAVSSQEQSSWCFHFCNQVIPPTQPVQALGWNGKEGWIRRECPQPAPDPKPLPQGYLLPFVLMGFSGGKLRTKQLSISRCLCSVNHWQLLGWHSLRDLSASGPALIHPRNQGPTYLGWASFFLMHEMGMIIFLRLLHFSDLPKED